MCSYGVTDDVPRRLVLEMCEESLSAALHSTNNGVGAAVAAALSGDAAAMVRSCGSTPLLTLQQRLLVAGDVAAGLAHMHARDMVHFDVKVCARARARAGAAAG